MKILGKLFLGKLLLASTLLALTMSISSSMACAKSSDSNEPSYTIASEEITTKLVKLLDRVSKRDGKKFLLHSKARVDVVAYGVDEKNITYNELLQVIALNQMAAVEVEGYVNIVPIQNVKRLAIPAITNDTVLENDGVWVSKIINGGNLDVGSLLPILRSLVSVHGHFAQYKKSNLLVVVAPNAVVKRIEAIINNMKTESVSLKV
jgi:type II secretory pathway component GspD/PulD (secretin)